MLIYRYYMHFNSWEICSNYILCDLENRFSIQKYKLLCLERQVKVGAENTQIPLLEFC